MRSARSRSSGDIRGCCASGRAAAGTLKYWIQLIAERSTASSATSSTSSTGCSSPRSSAFPARKLATTTAVAGRTSSQREPAGYRAASALQ